MQDYLISSCDLTKVLNNLICKEPLYAGLLYFKLWFDSSFKQSNGDKQRLFSRSMIPEAWLKNVGEQVVKGYINDDRRSVKSCKSGNVIYCFYMFKSI